MALVLLLPRGVQAAPHAELQAAYKVMPLGDSITSGTDKWASYRCTLYRDLRARGWVLDFVGSIHGQLNSGQNPPAYCSDFDWDHEGHSGYRVDQILYLDADRNLAKWLTLNRPDLVLLFLGANDILQDQTVDSTVSELGQVIDTLRAANPHVKILLAQLTPLKWQGKTYSDVPVLNARLPALAAAKNQAASPVQTVDLYTGFNVDSDTVDGVHPNPSGEQKIATKFRAALEAVLTANLPFHRYFPVIRR